MSKFRRGKGKSLQAISTASLPDIVFMLLFFFMVTTTMKETTLQVQIVPPNATEIKKLEKKSLVSYIYIGKPTEITQAKNPALGNSPLIQIDGEIHQRKEVSLVQDYIIKEREKKSESERTHHTTSLKIDGGVTMGIVSDVKKELRKAGALKINYSTKKDK